MKMLLVDFETRSKVNLLTDGAHNYAQDASTDALCCAFELLNLETKEVEQDAFWSRDDKSDLGRIWELAEEADFVVAWNAGFDRLIWEYVAVPDHDFPFVEFDRWYCASAQARVNNLPAGLDDCARALNAKHKKDTHGKFLIKQLSLPQPDGTFNEDPTLMQEMYDYGAQDVRVMRAIILATRIMTQTEHDDWLNNEDINERGVKIDVALAKASQKYANDEICEISECLNDESNGVVTKHTQVVRAAKWIVDEIGADHKATRLMQKPCDEGVKYSIDKGIRAELISQYDSGDIDLPENVINLIVLIDSANASSVAKFKNMMHRADYETQRVQGAFIYAGASQTLRYSSRGLQLHNFPSRGLYKTQDEAWKIHDLMIKQLDIPKPTMDTLKKMLRHAIMAEKGNKLIVGDWSGIEARVLPWLSDCEGGRKKLAKIVGGIDVYIEAAKAIGLDDRQVGKVMELACGYEGGLGAFKQFAKMYGVVMPEHQMKSAIKTWRQLNSWVVMFWRELEHAALAAMKKPKTIQHAGRVRFMYSPKLMSGSLLAILPDDSVLTYPKARLERSGRKTQITYLHASVKMKADDSEWPRASLYGGRLAGHVTQGSAAALLRDLIGQLDEVIAHVHDEVILEVQDEDAEKKASNLKELMNEVPTWAAGLPLKCEPEILDRYKK